MNETYNVISHILQGIHTAISDKLVTLELIKFYLL